MCICGKATLTLPLRQPLARILDRAAIPRADVLTEAAYELIMSRQTTWITLGHEPTTGELATYAQLVVGLVGLGCR
ncbi:hypothetical protein [Candidatus Protofrankia californiensis]|uniref:hypothetical protein n=1 Tax=Candidatus Protofrankia californiensis TaxID=1839754 RepID=UPI00104118F4|nr:hypothetical protein [Candidatus Protofrankia californiensis]